MAKYKIWNGKEDIVVELRTIVQARKMAYEISRASQVYGNTQFAAVFKFDEDIWDYVRIGSVTNNLWIESYNNKSDKKYAINSKGQIKSIWG